MSTRQYIGARYVPKFFEGTGGSIEWAGGSIPYEALVMVTHLNNTYTSKKPVPVGIDITNTEYWALTGNFNSQISALATELDVVEDRVEVLEDSYKHNIIYIGDSYAEGYTPDGSVTSWITYCNSMLGSLLGEHYIGRQGGAGFMGDQYDRATFLSLLQGLDDDIEDKNNITDIIVGGCVNDLSGDVSTLPTYLQNFAAYAKTNYPKAKLWLAPFGRKRNVSAITSIKSFLPIWSASVIYGFNYIDRSNLILHSQNYFSSDGIHPNANGQRAIGSYLASVLQGGDIDMFAIENTTFSSNICHIAVSAMKVYFENDKLKVVKDNTEPYVLTTATQYTFGRSFSLNLGSINSGLIKSNGIDKTTVNVRLLSTSDNRFFDCAMLLSIEDNTLVLTGSVLNANATNYLTATISEIHIGKFALDLSAYNC